MGCEVGELKVGLFRRKQHYCAFSRWLKLIQYPHGRSRLPLGAGSLISLAVLLLPLRGDTGPEMDPCGLIVLKTIYESTLGHL